MRHRKSGRKLKRTASHRRATLSALATALLQHKRIQTTVAKAKETRMVVEPIITRAKNAVAEETEAIKNIHARRVVARFIKDKDVVFELFNVIAPKVADRPGGYTRIVKLGRRQGDAGEIAVIEPVDFNAMERSETKPKKTVKSKKKKELETPQLAN